MVSPTTLEELALLEQVKRGNGQVKITNRPPSMLSRIIQVGQLIEKKGIVAFVVHEKGGAIRASETVELTPKGRSQ